jgi:hypothetical protein
VNDVIVIENYVTFHCFHELTFDKNKSTVKNNSKCITRATKNKLKIRNVLKIKR